MAEDAVSVSERYGDDARGRAHAGNESFRVL